MLEGVNAAARLAPFRDPCSTSDPRPERRTRAFTLIELLIVIAIIAVLIGILLPSLRSVRQAGRQLKCANQQRQLATGILQYALDNREHWHAVWANEALRFNRVVPNRHFLVRPFIEDRATGRVRDTEAYWAALYDPYMGVALTDSMFSAADGIGAVTSLAGWQVTRCPEARFTLPAFRAPGGGVLPHDPFTLHSTYVFNGVTPGFDGIPLTAGRTFFERQGSARVPRELVKLEFPSSIIMFHDGSEVMMDGNGDTLVQLDQWTGELFPPDNVQWIREYFRHSNMCNVAWADGHVSTIGRAEAQNARDQTRRRFGAVRGVPLVWYSVPGVTGAD